MPRDLHQHIANVEDGHGDVKLVSDQSKIGLELIETGLSVRFEAVVSICL